MYKAQVSSAEPESREHASGDCASLRDTTTRGPRRHAGDATVRGDIKRRPELRPVAEILPDISAKTRTLLVKSQKKV
ncbi:hypothetical protein OCH239_00055 [Roseivivax halodurans JCM 10272]|uniref:Uncharacterized protein n=1 Tax=Roseivivax halodurans JCM 10272 TaxID=1449350 RepID=X7ENB7_9RHOB|nr:hypothetical protein [Roseivivax halodurans]ETX16696.1 hypothetical protein OCH239_00055 [Roseivivax halodurans JCM 10272]